MFLTYIVFALLLGLIVGAAMVMFWHQISTPLQNFFQQWLFRHKAIHPYRIKGKSK